MSKKCALITGITGQDGSYLAELLLDKDELLEYIYQYRYSAEQIASAMSTDINLVALKIAHLNELGYDLRPSEYRNNFLKS